MTSIGSISSSTTTTYLSRLDTNGDGVLSADELAAANTATSKATGAASTTSEDDAGLGSSATAQLSSLLTSMMLQISSGDETQEQETGEGKAGQLSVSKLDTDGDGVVSATEFAAAKPDDVSDEMSAQLFSTLDADGDGSVTDSELSTMRNGPPPPPSPNGDEVVVTDDETSAEDLLAQIQKAVEQYAASLADVDDATETILTV